MPNSAKTKRPDPMILKLFRLGFQVGGRLAPPVAGKLAYRLWLTPTRFKTPASEQKALESADIKFLQINDHKIATFHWGQSGPTVLLVHGWSGRGAQLGSFVEPLIEAGYRVLSFDAPGHGKSSGKQSSLYKIVDTLLALQEHFGNFDSIITHSFGGPCVAKALQQGLTTKRLVSIAPPASTQSLVDKYTHFLRIPNKARNSMARHIENQFGEAVWQDLSMVNTVKELKIPGLLIHDTHDIDIPWQEGYEVSQAWGNAEFIKTSELGHRRILRDAGVIEAVVKFVVGKNED